MTLHVPEELRLLCWKKPQGLQASCRQVLQNTETEIQANTGTGINYKCFGASILDTWIENRPSLLSEVEHLPSLLQKMNSKN